MQELLKQLGFNEKEIKVYLSLIELGTKPASLISKKIKLPKSTTLFILNKLYKSNFIKRTQKGKTQYFHADPNDLQKAFEQQHQNEKSALQKAIPLLQELKNPYSSEPKLTFFEGIEGCKKIYKSILESKTEVLEFGAHNDLVTKFGEKFMEEFMDGRAKNQVHLRAISKKDQIHQKISKNNKKHLRKLKFFNPEKGNFYSSIAIFDDKVLLLNLYHDAFAILIENPEVTKTLTTIFEICWEGN